MHQPASGQRVRSFIAAGLEPRRRGRHRAGRERVEVVAHVAATQVVPDLLGWIGFSIAKERLEATTVMAVEQ